MSSLRFEVTTTLRRQTDTASSMRTPRYQYKKWKSKKTREHSWPKSSFEKLVTRTSATKHRRRRMNMMKTMRINRTSTLSWSKSSDKKTYKQINWSVKTSMKVLLRQQLSTSPPWNVQSVTSVTTRSSAWWMKASSALITTLTCGRRMLKEAS